MPSPELQATIDSFDYRSYLKMKGLSDEEIPETLSPEAKQKIYSRAYSEYIGNEIKALQAETPGGMSKQTALKEIEERELEESPHLRPLWGYWEKELTAEDVYRPEMLFPVLKEKYGIDLSDPNFDIDKLGEKGKTSLDDVINAYVPNIVNKQTHRNVPELEGIKKSEFAKQFRERNALLQGDTVESFLTQYRKKSEEERIAEDEQKRPGLDYWSDLGEQAWIQGRQMLYGYISGYAQSLVQDPRIPFTNIRWDGASPGTDEGNTLFNRTLLDLAAWGTRKHADAVKDGEKKEFVPRYSESPIEYGRQGEWGKVGGSLIEQLVLNGASTVQTVAAPLMIGLGNRIITPVTRTAGMAAGGFIGGLAGGPAGAAAGAATGMRVGQIAGTGLTLGGIAGLMIAGGLMTASDVVADLHDAGIYDQSKVDAYLEHVATAVALDSAGTIIDGFLVGGGKMLNAIPFIRNRTEAAAQKAALEAAARANGLDTTIINHLAGKQLLRNQALRRQGNARLWEKISKGSGGWSVMRRTAGGALVEGGTETQQEAINMDLVNKMTSFDQEGNWSPGLTGLVWPFAWEQANREGGYRFPEKMVRHRLETAGSVGAVMGAATTFIGSSVNEWKSAKARAAEENANVVTDAQGNKLILGAAEQQRNAARRVFADMQNRGKGVNAQTISGVNLTQAAGVSVANFNGVTGTGENATDAFIDLTMRANAGRKNINESTLTAVNGGHEVTLANGEKLTFLGTNSEQMLRDLVNLHNSDNHPLTITGGATIEYTPGAKKPYKITRSNGVSVNVESLYDNYAFYNFSTNADSSLVMDSILRRTGSQSAESTIGIDITQTGAFNFTNSEQAIRDSINNSSGRLILLDSAKTRKGATARVRKNGALQSDTMSVLDTEDGVIYTIKLKQGRNNSNAYVNVTARDLGGRKLTLDPDVAKQTIRSAADPAALRNQIRLKSPKAGITIQGETIAGQTGYHFKADQIAEIARRTGASVIHNRSNYVEFQLPSFRWTPEGRMESFGTTFALRLDDSGKVWADSMGTTIEIEGINDYQAITPGETNLYAHALQGGKYTTTNIDPNTGAVTMRRTAPSGAEVEVVLGRRGTIDSYRIVENNAQQIQNMIDAAIAARNAQTSQQQAVQQQMGQIVDPDLTTYTSQEIAAAGFDPLTIDQRLKAVLHAQIAGHIWSPISTFEGIRNIIQAEFGFPMDRFMVQQVVSETGTVNGWSIRNINDEEMGFFNNDTQGLRDFKAFMTDDVINDMFALDRLTPYLLEQLMNNPQRAIFDLTSVEYKAAVDKFFAYHDAVFRPQTDTSQMTRSADRRFQVEKSVHIQIDDVVNGRVVLPDIAAVRAFYGDLIEQGYGIWDNVLKKFAVAGTTGKRQYGDRAYIQGLIQRFNNPNFTIRYLYKLGDEYYTENELVKAAHDKKNFDLLTDDVINDMIEKRLQGMQERPLDVAARGNRRYIDILNETIFKEVRSLLDSQYDSIDELIKYFNGNLVKRQTFRVHTTQGYMYVGKDNQLYSVQQVQNDPSIQELVSFDSTQYPSLHWRGMGARKYADIYQLRNEDGSLLLNEHVNLRTMDGRSAVPQATVDANLKRITDRLRGKDVLIQYFNTFATNDSINDQIIDEDNEPEIPGPDRSKIETDLRNKLKADALNAQTIMEFFEIYGHQFQERFAILDTSNGIYAGRTGNASTLGVDTFLTQSEVGEYIQKNGLNQNQVILEYYVFYNNDLSAIESFNTMTQEDSFMNELRRPDKIDLIDITRRVDDEFQAEEVRVGQQKAKREALRNQRAAAAAAATQQAATGGGPSPMPASGPVDYADYLTRLFGPDSFVNLNAKVELFDGNLTGLMEGQVEELYWKQHMANAQGEEVRDVNDPARSLDGELNRTVGKLWRDAKRRGLVQVHKTVVEFLATQPRMRDEQLERIVRGMLGVELQKPQAQVTQAEIQTRINSLSTDEQNNLLRNHFTPQGYYEVVQNPGQNQPGGRVHLIEENIPWEMGDRVFYHEVAVHASLFLGGEIAERWRTIIQYLKDHKDDDTDLGKAVRAIISNRGDMGQTPNTFGYWEEVSAYFVADNLNKIGFASRIKAMFRDWFRLSGIVGSRGDITTADIVRFARASTEVAISRSNELKKERPKGMKAKDTFSMMGASFHADTETMRDQYEAVRQHYANAHYSHMSGMVHDKLTGLPNYSNLDGTHWVLARTPIFKKWFGDWETNASNASKIVDTAGEPLLVFHNTKYDHEAYDELFVGLNGNFGHSGQSIYGNMIENPYAEKFRGNTVAQTFVNMRKPLHMHNYEETARYMEALGYEQSARRLDLRKLGNSVRNDPRLRTILQGIEDYAADPQPGTSFADFMLLNDNLIYDGIPLTDMEEAHRFLNGLFEAATTPGDSILTNEPVENANTVEEWQETLDDEETKAHWRQAADIFETRLKPYENQMLRLAYNPDGYFTHYQQAHEDLSVSTRERIKDVLSAVDRRYYSFGERDMIEFRQALMDTYAEISQLPESSLSNDELFVGMVNMSMHNLRTDELHWRLGEDLDFVTTPAYPVPTAQSLLKEHNHELAVSLKGAMMRDGYDGILGTEDILVMHPDQSKDVLEFKRLYPEKSYNPTRGLRENPVENRVVELLNDDIERDAKVLGVPAVRLRSEYRSIYRAFREQNPWSESNLDEYQWILTRTPSFKENFGDWQNDVTSDMVLDTNGEPLRTAQGFVHGTGTVDVGENNYFSVRSPSPVTQTATEEELVNYIQEAEQENPDENGYFSFAPGRSRGTWETEDVYYGPTVRPGMSETYIGLPTASVIPQEMRDNFGVRFVESAEEAERVHQQYEAAMSKQSDYTGPVYQNLLARRSVLYEDNGSYIVAPRKAIQATGNIFVISHFAPKGMKDGVRMVKNLATGSMKVIAAVPPYQGNMLRKAGFDFAGQTVQPFHGELVLKDVYTSQSVTQEEKDELFKHYTAGRSQAEMDALIAKAKRISGKKDDDGGGYFSMIGRSGSRMPAMNASPDPITEYIPYERAQEFYGTGEGSMVWGPGTYVQLPLPEGTDRTGVAATPVISAANYRKWWKSTSSLKIRDEDQSRYDEITTETARLEEEMKKLKDERSLIRDRLNSFIEDAKKTIDSRLRETLYGTLKFYSDKDGEKPYLGVNEFFDSEGNHYVVPRDTGLQPLNYQGRKIYLGKADLSELIKFFGVDEVRKAFTRSETFLGSTSESFKRENFLSPDFETELRSLLPSELAEESIVSVRNAHSFIMHGYKPLFDEDGTLIDIVPASMAERNNGEWKMNRNEFFAYIKNGKLYFTAKNIDDTNLGLLNDGLRYPPSRKINYSGNLLPLDERDIISLIYNVEKYNEIVGKYNDIVRNLNLSIEKINSKIMLQGRKVRRLENEKLDIEERGTRSFYGSLNLITVPSYDEMIFDPDHLGAQSVYVQDRLATLIEDYHDLGAISQDFYLELQLALTNTTKLEEPFRNFNESSWSTRQLLLKLGAAIAKYNGDTSQYADSNTYTKVLLDYGIKGLRYVGSHDKHAAVIFDGRDIDVVENVLPAQEDLSLEEVRRVYEHVRPNEPESSENVRDYYFSMASRQMQPSASPEQREFEEIRGYFSMLRDFDPFTQAVIKTYEKDRDSKGKSIFQLMNEAKSPGAFGIVLDDLAEAAYRKVSQLEVKASKNNIRNIVATLIVQDPRLMRSLWNKVMNVNTDRERDEWLPYQEDINEYTDDQLDMLTPEINKYLTNRRFGLFAIWYDTLSKYPSFDPVYDSAMNYLIWRSLYNNFKKRNASSMPIEAIEKYLGPALDIFERTWRSKPNFYEIYAQVIMDDLITNASDLVEIGDEKIWVKIAYDSENATDRVIAASMNTAWCTNGQGGERTVIEEGKHDFWVLYDLNLKESVLAFVPVRDGEESMLTHNRGAWYTGIFNRENPKDNYVPEPLKSDVRKLFEGTRDTDVQHTLRLLGENWMNEEELEENAEFLFDTKLDRLRDYLTLNSILSDEILPLFREVTGIDIIQSDEGDFVFTGNFTNDIFDTLYDIFDEGDLDQQDFYNRVVDTVLNSIDRIEGDLDVAYGRRTGTDFRFGRLTSVNGNLVAYGAFSFPILEFVGGNFGAGGTAKFPQLTRVFGRASLYLDQEMTEMSGGRNVEVHPLLQRYMDTGLRPGENPESQPSAQVTLSDEELSDNLDDIFNLPEAPPENNNFFSMMRRRGVTNYNTDIYDRTEIVGSNGAYKLKNGKIFIDVNQVGQENVARVLLYALVRENQAALNNPVMGRMLSFIQGWENSQDPRLRGLYADIRMDMMNDHVPDTALLAYAVRRMMADGVDPTNPQAEDTPEGVFAGIIGEVPNIIGQVGGVSTGQVNATTADIVTVVNAISGVENVPIDVAVPSMGLTEAQMQAAYTRPVPFMDAIMAEVKEIVDRYDGASFDYIDGKPHLILGGQGGMVLNLSDNPLFAKNVVDQLMDKLTDFGNFDTMTTDPNAKPGDPGNPFTEIINKIGTNSQLGTQATEADVNKFINENLPAYIADRIQVIYNETDEYKALFGDTYGALYRPVTADRKVIFVRAYGRNLADVIGSIMNMTSYFGWTQYNNADFTPLMGELWTVLKHNIQTDLPTYYAKLNGQEPSTSQKSALISAYLASKSTSIYELAEFAKTSNVAPGDEQRMLDIAKKVKDQITKVELNMATSFARDFGVNKEAVQEYTEKLLRMTMAPYYGKGMWFAYDVDYDTYKANDPNNAEKYKDFGHVMVFANDFGPVYKPVPFSEDALSNQIMLQKYRQMKPAWKNFHLALWRNWHPPMKHIGDTILGIQNTIAMSRAFQAVTTEWGSALKNVAQEIQALDDILIRKGIDTEEFDRAKGYVQELKDRGITDEKLLKRVEIPDIFLRVGREKMLNNVTQIRALIRDSAMEAETWMRKEGVSEKEIQKMHMEMDRFASRFVSDWEHRSYRAYMDEGQNDLQEMWNILDGQSPATTPAGSLWFSNAVRNAQQELTQLEQDRAQGVIAERAYADRRKELKKTVRMYERLDALYHWVNQNVMASLPKPGSLNYQQELANVPRKVNDQMKAEIQNVMTLVSSEKVRGNLGKMDLIPAVRKRRLNENNPHDVLYMTFLDRVKNPGMAMAYNLDQQGKVLDKLIFNLQFGRSILQSGMGTIKGSREHVNLGVDNLSWMETGTLLRYIKIDPFFLDEIRHEQEIQLKVYDTVYGGLLNVIKQNFTILNWRMMVSNYVGNASNLIATGHFFRFRNWAPGHAVGWDKFKSLFVQKPGQSVKVLEGKKGAQNVLQAMHDYEAEIAKYKEEMEKLNVWGSGTTTYDLTRYGTGGIEKISQLVSGVIEATGAIDEVGSRSWNRRVNKGMNFARELYGFGDEWVKTLTYINNRAVMIAKYRAQENWAQYAGNEGSLAAVAADNRIREMAKRDAALLTMKETTTWELSPDYARQISASPIRVIAPDFLLHGFQMARIMAVNVGRTRECAEEVARLRLKPSLTEDERLYLSLVTNELVRRTVGQAMMLWIGAEAASYGGSALVGMIGSVLAFLRGEGDDDDERRKRRSRKKDDPAQMTPAEQRGLSMLCNYVSQVSDLYAPLMWKPGHVGDFFYAINFQRMNAALTLLPVRPATNNPSILQRMEHIMWELVDLRSDTLSVQVANTLKGKDRYGRDLTKSEILGEIANYLTPQGIHQMRNVALGIKDMVLGTEDIGWREQKKNRPLSVFDLAGIKVRQYSVNDMIEQVGRRISALEREQENPYKRNFFQKLQRNLDMTDADISSVVSDIIEVNKTEMERINYAIEAFRLLNIDRATMIRGLTTGREQNTPNLGQKEVAFLLAGRDVLTERLKTNLETKMKALQSPVEGSNMSDTERRKLMENYRRAHRMISEALR